MGGSELRQNSGSIPDAPSHIGEIESSYPEPLLLAYMLQSRAKFFSFVFDHLVVFDTAPGGR